MLKYEDLLTTRDALVKALAQLETCQKHSHWVKRYSPDLGSAFVIPEKEFDDVINQTREAFYLVGGAVFDYEWEQNHSIAQNAAMLYGEDIPF